MLSIDRMGFATARASLQLLEKDYYNILDVPSTATPEQIKEKYRQLAKQYHPDAKSLDKSER